MLTGNRDFNEIYNKYKNLVLKIAYIYSGNDYHAAEDITHDIFLKLYTGFDDFDEAKIGPWLRVVARNEALNYRKKRKREHLSEDYESIAETGMLAESIEEEYLENVQNSEMKSLNAEILSGLMEKNPRWHEAVLLAYYVKIPQARVAEMMNINIRSLHSILHRAKEWVKKTYGVEYEEMNQK